MEQINQLAEMEQEIEIQCYSQKTKKVYLSHVKSFLRFCNGKPEQEKIKRFLYYLKISKKYSPSSLNTAKYALIYFFTNMLKQDMVINIPKIKREKQYPKFLTEGQITKILEVISNPKHKLLVEVAYGSGLRLSEAISIQWEDINFDEKTLTIRHGKGNKDRITIISEQALQHLKKWQNKQEELVQKSKWVFNSQARDFHISEKTFQKILQKSAEKAGLEIRVFPHRLRHSFGKHLLDNGTDIRFIQKLLGHNSIKSTQIYTYVSNRDIKNIQSPLDKINQGQVKEEKVG